MPKFTLTGAAMAAIVLAGCGTTDPRDEVVYPYSQPVPRADYRAPAQPAATRSPSYSGSGCPGDAEELAPGSICPASAKCFEVSGGKRCIEYEK